MKFLVDFINLKKFVSEYNLKRLLLYVLIGILLTVGFSGKNRADFETIAVSANEQFIACFETGTENKRIRCFRADGSLSYDYDIQSDISAGGYCTLWFEDDVLCAQFYRTDKIVYLSTDGRVIKITENTAEDPPPVFPRFVKEGHKYIYTGKEIDVIYDKRSFLSFWFFDADRYLAIVPRNGEKKIVCSWTAKG